MLNDRDIVVICDGDNYWAVSHDHNFQMIFPVRESGFYQWLEEVSDGSPEADTILESASMVLKVIDRQDTALSKIRRYGEG